MDYLCRDRAPSAPLEVLSDSVLGIEVDHYLRKIIQQSRSPIYTPWAGMSPSVLKTVEKDMETLQKNKIEPLFVFSGLQVSQQYEMDSNIRLANRSSALQDLEKRRNDETITAFATLTTPSDLALAFREFLRTKGTQFLVAPYFAGAQLAYMLGERIVDAVFASADIMLFGADKVITEIQFAHASRISFCDKSFIIGTQLAGLNDDQFLDAYLFSGNEFCSLVPILEQNPPSEYSSFRIRAAADVVRQNGSGYQALNGNPLLDKKPRYVDDWLRARSLYRHHPYLDKSGDIVLMNPDKAPDDLTKIFGPRLPREIYFYLSRGLLDLPMVDALISGTWHETMPMSGGDTKEYRALLDGLQESRVQCFELLHGSKQLHNYLEKRHILSNRWYVKGHQEEFERFESPLYDDLGPWKVNSAFVRDFSHQSIINLCSMLQAIKAPTGPEASFNYDDSKHAHLEDLHINVFYRLLQLRGYITSTHCLSDWGEALLGALIVSKGQNSERVMVAVEMLKLQALKFDGFQTRSGSTSQEFVSPTAHWNVIARLGALLPVEQNDAPWQGPIDRDGLTAFAMTQIVSQSLGHLFEVIRSIELMRGSLDKMSSRRFSSLEFQNPFVLKHDAAFLLYAKHYFAHLDGSTKDEKMKLFTQLGAKFPTIQEGPYGIECLYLIWDALFRAAGIVAARNLMGSLELKKFQDSDDWLKERR